MPLTRAQSELLNEFKQVINEQRELDRQETKQILDQINKHDLTLYGSAERPELGLVTKMDRLIRSNATLSRIGWGIIGSTITVALPAVLYAIATAILGKVP